MAVQIVYRRDLPSTATNGRTSTVTEPSIATYDGTVLFTGNWFAAKSGDTGTTWRHLDPFSFFPPADQGFCCDQTTLYDPSRDIFIWLLQYSRTSQCNTLRIAVKRGPTLDDDNAWIFWDLVPDQIDPSWQNEWFDFNHAGLSDNFLHIVTNSFTTDPPVRFSRCVALRLPLDDLQAGSAPSLEHFETNSFSLRCTQGATTTMHFAAHIREAPARLRIFSWPDSSATATSSTVGVTQWKGGNGYFAPGPGGNWLSRCDPRITAGWIADGNIGFAWTVDRFGSRPQPHIRIARINESTGTLVDEPDIWHSDFAFAWPDVSPNLQGEVGLALFFGGNTHDPSHAVGTWDEGTQRWSLSASHAGTHGPAEGKWGDYLTCRPAHPDSAAWDATGFVLRGGSSHADIQPFYVHFKK